MSKYQYNIQTAYIDGDYRYYLTRFWEESKGAVVFIMLNPSTADAGHDDPTIRACVDFAKNLGYGGMYIVNLFAFRATNPDKLNEVLDPFGPENYSFVTKLCESSIVKQIICAWGSKLPLKYPEAGRDMVKKLNHKGITTFALKVNLDGNPTHPLYLKRLLKPFEFTYEVKI